MLRPHCNVDGTTYDVASVAGELYQVIRTVVPTFEESNFIRKVTSTQSRKGILEEALGSDAQPATSTRYSQRPAQLYRFTDYSPELSIYG